MMSHLKIVACSGSLVVLFLENLNFSEIHLVVHNWNGFSSNYIIIGQLGVIMSIHSLLEGKRLYVRLLKTTFISSGPI